MSGFYFEIRLPDASDPTTYLTSPTIEEGDFKTRLGGTGSLAILTNTPVVEDGIVRVTLTSAEANGQGVVVWEDPEGTWLPGYMQFDQTGTQEEVIAAALLDLDNGVEPGWTLRQALRIILAASGGELSGAGGTNIKIRDMADTKDRINALVDANGNRSSVTLDPS